MDEREYSRLSAALAAVPDPRRKRGVRHRWEVILVLIGAALLAGQHHVHAMGQWVDEHADVLRGALPGSVKRLPSEATLRRALVAIDVAALHERLARVSDPAPTEEPRARTGLIGYALDGKQVRGATAHGQKVHLLAVARHGDGRVLAQVEVGQKTNEIGAAPTLLAGLDLTGTLLTMDALLAQRALAEQIRAQGGHYLMILKANQPETYAAVAELFTCPPWLPHERAEAVSCRTTVSKGHGRLEQRTLEASATLSAWVRWPGVAQVLRRQTRRMLRPTGVIEEETTYGLTSVSPDEVSVEQLEGFWRGHWGIENRVHYVRDVTLGEDAGQAHTGSIVQALALLRNALILRLRQAGWTCIADALRHYAAHPVRALKLLGLSAA